MTMADAEAKAPDANPDSRQHHEKAIMRAFIAMAIIVVGGFFLANFAARLLKGNPDALNGARDYNGFQFVKSGNAWLTQWQREGVVYNLEFRHPPWDVENITVQGEVDLRFQRDFMFITHDPTDNASRATAFVAVAAADLTSILTNVFEKKGIVPACTANLTASCAARPIANCSTNASVIYLKVSDETGIFLDGNCATFQGREENLTRAVNKGIYQWMDIVNR